MPFLKIADGQEKQVRVTSGQVVSRVVHWVGQKAQDCSGSGCQLCAVGLPANTRYQLDVTWGGDPYTWSFPSAVKDQLTGLAGDMSKLAGKQISVSRSGTGSDTRYTLLLLEGVRAEAVPPSIPSEGPVHVLAQILGEALADPRFWAILEEKLGGEV